MGSLINFVLHLLDWRHWPSPPEQLLPKQMPSPNSFHHLAVLIIILHIAAGACSQDHPPFLTFCSGDNYTESSPYKSNLNSLISDLVSSTPNSPTYFSLINSTTTSPNIYGLAQCRPDVSSVGCAACLNNMASIAPKPDGGCELKTSGFFRDQNCLLIYSGQMFYTALQEQIYVFLTELHNASSVSFSRHMQAQIDTVILSASESALRFAVGLAEAPADAVDIFTMGWCSMDLTTDDCFQCLNNVLKVMPAGKNRGTCVTVSCVARFETYQFYSTSMIPAESGNTTTTNKTTLAAPVVSAGNNNNKTTSVAPVVSEGNDSDNTTTVTPGVSAGKKNKTTAVAAGVSGTVAFVLLFALFILLLRRRKSTALNMMLPMDEELSNAEIKLISFSALKKSTNNFAYQNKLGQGGFGPVYKGVLINGQEIAVKRLSAASMQGIQEMKNEIQFVANLRHKNLVRLLGYCLQREEKILIYEFLPNTSLDKFLFNPIRKMQLDWETRLKIIVGVGRGLLYLHEDSHLRIVHRDLKASNILLDGDMNPKISDFGLAKLFKNNEAERNTSRIAGTLGYMAPEYVLHGLFSTKSDVFSYGVLVLEIITGMKPSLDESEEAVDLQSFVWQHWREGRAFEVVDRSLEDRYSAPEVLKCVQIGLLCVQEDQVMRPKMGSVVMMLSSPSVKLESPSMPAFYKERSISVESESASRSGDTELLKRGTSHHDIVLPGMGQ